MNYARMVMLIVVVGTSGTVASCGGPCANTCVDYGRPLSEATCAAHRRAAVHVEAGEFLVRVSADMPFRLRAFDETNVGVDLCGSSCESQGGDHHQTLSCTCTAPVGMDVAIEVSTDRRSMTYTVEASQGETVFLPRTDLYTVQVPRDETCGMTGGSS